VGGHAVKGPTDKIMTELARDRSARGVAHHYAGIIDAMLVDERDAPETMPGLPHICVDTLMQSPADRARVAAAALDFAEALG
jgi:LPPG:FO 2-phospho-L-lactate transferase